MPHTYTPDEDRFVDRVLHHPERIVALWWCIAGTLLTVAVIGGRTDLSGALENFSRPVLLAIVLALAAGGGLVNVVSLMRTDARAWRVERLGWVLAIGAWIGYGAALWAYTIPPRSVTSWTLPAAMILLAVVRLIALGRDEDRVRSNSPRSR